MTQKEFKQKYKPWLSSEILYKINETGKISKKF